MCFRMIYWSNWGSVPKIERVSMTGERRQVLVSTLIVWPNGITLDLAKRFLYWADARLDRVREEKLVQKNSKRDDFLFRSKSAISTEQIDVSLARTLKCIPTLWTYTATCSSGLTGNTTRWDQ